LKSAINDPLELQPSPRRGAVGDAPSVERDERTEEEMSDLPHYTKEQFDKLVEQLQASFLVTAIDYESNFVGTLQGQEGWRLMLLHLDLEGQTASFKVWVAKGEDNVDAKV